MFFSNESMLRKLFQVESGARNFLEEFAARMELYRENFPWRVLYAGELSTEGFLLEGRGIIWRARRFSRHYLKNYQKLNKKKSFSTESKDYEVTLRLKTNRTYSVY